VRGDTVRDRLPPADLPALNWGLRLLGLLVVAGAFLGGTGTWGFDHLAWLPRWWLAAVLPLVGFLFWIGGPRLPGEGRTPRVHRLLFLWRPGVVVWPVVAGCLFHALRTRAHFLGDGYLLLDVLGREHELRPLESFGYLLLEQCRPLFASAPDPSLAVYRAASIAAGVTGVLLVRLLLPRTSWEPARQVVFLGLHLAGASTLLYCGYVEHYAFLYAFLTAFTLAGLAAAEGRAPLRLPAILLAAAMAAHLSAVLALPALVVLAWRGTGGTGRRRRVVVALAPTIVVVAGLVVALAARAGGLAAVADSLRSNANLGQPLRPLTGEGGLLSARAWIDVVNLVLLLAPVPLVMLLSARRGDAEPDHDVPVLRFLATHAAVLLAAMVLVEPKLGAARDWDLLGAHAAVLAALAVAVVPAARLRPRRLVVAALACSLPWFALGLDAPAAARRLAVEAKAFRPYPQAYAFEGLGKYHRDGGRNEEVAAMYLAATRAQPDNARFHALLGAAYVTLYNDSDEAGRPQESFMEQAEASYREAHRLNPIYPAVMDNLARLYLRKGGYAEAESLMSGLGERQALTLAQLQMLIYCQYRLGRPDAVAETRRRILALDPAAVIPPAWLAGVPSAGP
jgi:hypothetical protein